MRQISNKILAFLLIGVISMCASSGCSKGSKYEKYSSKDPALNITMDYISGWRFSETRGANNSYADVFFSEPVMKDQKLPRAFMEVTSIERSKIGIDHPTISAVSEDIVNKRLKFKEGKLLGRSKIKLRSGEATVLNFSFTALDKLYSIDAKPVPVKERVVILEDDDDRFYIVKYENREEVFDKYSKDFDHIIKSLRFKEKR